MFAELLEMAKGIEPVVWVAALSGFIGLLSVLAAARALFPQSDPVLDRLRAGLDLGRVGAELDPATSVVRKGANLDQKEAGKRREASQVYRLLIHAGYRDPGGVTLFMVGKLILAIGLPTIFLVVWSAFSGPIEHPVWIALAICVGGYFTPNLWLFSKVRSRQTAIERSLPDTLDLLVTCVEAGLGLDAAILRVSEEQELAAPVLAAEIKTTFLEIQAGMARTEAFRRMSDRTGVDDLKSLSATLNQTEIFGTSVSEALRVQSDWIRNRRMQVAEEKAATVAVKMTLPLVLFILPSLILVIMGPAGIRIAKNLLPQMGGN